MFFKKTLAINATIFCLLMICTVQKISAAEFVSFSKTYVRETSAPTVDDVFNVLNPDTTWIMHVVNGSIQDDKVKKISSASITVNGEEILLPSQFNQNLDFIDIPVILLSENTISVTLKSKPGAQLTINFIGNDDDLPFIENLIPSNGTIINNSLPLISGQYRDDISGIDIEGIVFVLDGNNITIEAIITENSFEFTPLSPLVDGVHSFSVSVLDNAGNQAIETVGFTVVTSPGPEQSPTPNSTPIQTPNPTPITTLPPTFSPTPNPTPIQTPNPTPITTLPPTSSPTPDPSLDVTAPIITNISPTDGSTITNTQPLFTGLYSDNESGIDITSIVIMLDNNSVVSQSNITETSFEFTPSSPLNYGNHTFFISIKDNVGNQTDLTISFTITLSSDSDNLPDDWEMQYFNTLNETDNGDPDNDGVTNLDEYLQGRNPTKGAISDTNNSINLKIKTELED